MAKKSSNKKSNGNNKNVKQTTMIGVSSKGKKMPTPTAKPEKEKLTRKQIIILISVLLIAVMVCGTIVGAVIAVKKINNPDFMTSDLSRYISISAEDYKGYDINIPLDEFSEDGVQRKINMLLTEYKTLSGGYDPKKPLSLGDTVQIYFRGYTVDENGKETDFDGSSNFPEKSATVLEVGTGNVIDSETGKASGSFIPGFAESLVGIIPSEHSVFEKIKSGQIMAGDVIYLSCTVTDLTDMTEKTVKCERIDLGLTDIDEKYGKGFAEFFTGKLENGEIKEFKGVGNKLGDFVTRIGDSQTDNVAYSGMVVEFATRGCENKNADVKPITIKVTFPASYGEETLRGKEAYFDIYIESASPYSCPVFDDKFVTDNLKVTADELASYNGETLADKYREKLREEYRTEIEESNNDLLTQAVWSHIFSNVEIKKLPRATVKSYYNSYAADINNYYTNYTQQYENVDSFAVDYINNVYGAGLSAGADWKDYMTKLAEGDVAQKIIFYYIIREENLIPSDAEYQELYDERYNEIFDYYKELHASELAELEGEEYEKELESIKKEMESIYDESYFREQIYYQYGSQKLLGLANVVK